MPVREPESLVDLRQKANLTIPQACRLGNFSRPALNELLKDGAIKWFWRGKRKRVITESIFTYQDRESLARSA